MFVWQHYLNLADYLINNCSQIGLPEAAMRSAISRTYYSAYCLIRDWAFTYPSRPFSITRSGQDHRLLQNWLRNEAGLSGKVYFKSIALELAKLRDWRNQCDYDTQLQSQFLPQACTQALQKAQNILKLLAIIP